MSGNMDYFNVGDKVRITPGLTGLVPEAQKLGCNILGNNGSGQFY